MIWLSPEVSPVSTSCLPSVPLMMTAETPALDALILSRIDSMLALFAISMVVVFVASASLAVPSAIVSVPPVASRVTPSESLEKAVVDGLTLNLLAASAEDATTTITVTRSTSNLTNAVNAFVKAFNSYVSTASSLGSYNATTKTAGTLNGDSTLRSTQNQMRSLLTNIPSELSGSSYQLLSNIGVSLQKDGTLAVDSTKLSDAVTKDFNGVTKLLSVVGSKFDAAVESVTSSTGAIAARTDGLNATIKRYEKQYDLIAARLETIEARYRKQFTSLDTLISGMNSTSAYLTQQLANLSNLNSN